MNHIIRISLTLLAALTTAMALAQPASVAPAASDANLSISDQLAREQEQTALLLAKATNAKLRKQIKDDTSGPPLFSGLPGGLAAPLTAPKKVAPESEERVTSIQGAGSDYQAFVEIGNRTIIVEVGDTLSDGWRVTRITGSSVELSNGKTTRSLRI